MGFWFFNPTLVRYRIERTPTKVCFFIVLTSIGELTKHEAEQWSDNQFYDRPALGGELLIPQRFKDCSNNLIRQSLAHLKLGRFFLPGNLTADEFIAVDGESPIKTDFQNPIHCPHTWMNVNPMKVVD